MAFSQDLKPKIRYIEGQRHFCFTIAQSRCIAKHLESAALQGPIIDSLKVERSRWTGLLQRKDSIIVKLEGKVENLSLVRENDRMRLEALKKTIVRQNGKLKKGRLERWLFGGGLLVLTGMIIAK